MRIPKLTKSRDGFMRATITVQYRVEIFDLAKYFWDASPWQETCAEGERPEISISEIHKRVSTAIHRRGADFYIDDDEFWDNGGKEWATRQVERAYKEA